MRHISARRPKSDLRAALLDQRLRRLVPLDSPVTPRFLLPMPGSSNLTSFDLTSNDFHGPIDAGICNSSAKIRILRFSENRFYGHLPRGLKNCSSLTELWLSMNDLSGDLPDALFDMTSMTQLFLQGNQFSGNLSTNMSNLSNLVEIDLSLNRFSGLIPDVFGSLANVESFSAQSNKLVGNLPSSLSKLSSLRVLNLNNNSLSGEINLNCTAIPKLSTLDLGSNSFSGPIPDLLPHCVLLKTLNLAKNNLSGEIPHSFKNFTSLSDLSLTGNHFSNISSALQILQYCPKLTSLVLTRNFHGGEMMPVDGIHGFEKMELLVIANCALTGNSELCGIHLLPCKSKDLLPSRVKKHKRAARISMAVGIGIGTIFLLGVVYWMILRRHSGKHEDNAKVVARADESSDAASCSIVLLFHDDSKELNIDDILKSTNNFDQSFIVGCGGYGLVYKATLPDGRNIAIKRLSGDFFQVEREFQAEVETLSRAQHRNLVSLQGYCKFGNDRLLIYSYMENGSLDYWLHEKHEGSLMLDWGRRLQVALGAARGLAYLHESCEPHILHRDIKSSNILLDEEFEAHLADFGLARLVSPSETHVTTDLVGTLGYIPPEYAQSPAATFKGDVYSFGIVLLELLTGRRPVDMCKPKGSRNVVSWVLQMKKERREAEVFDPCIYDKDDSSQISRMLELACLCVSESPKLRPSTNQLVSWLEEICPNGQPIDKSEATLRYAN
ncbi:hypothetical protein B296_00046706 [Ensete ventricosum]|uniref:non-specific serine/threonine protein kinase n=1 Tax=Ensete ventricosum TaxID=4639 RepID=A0A426XHB3_ENSVE|nr:hypothetical protein B296_00046706 [Ensete ventricosum]